MGRHAHQYAAHVRMMWMGHVIGVSSDVDGAAPEVDTE
jgi:hypothetical protein